MIFATPSQNASSLLGVISVASKLKLEERIRESKRVKHETLLTLGFLKEDKIGTFPNDDALVLTLHIGGYDVKMVLVG